MRLTAIGREIGLVDDERWEMFSEKSQRVTQEHQRLRSTRVAPSDPLAQAVMEISGHNGKLSISKHPSTWNEALTQFCFRSVTLVSQHVTLEHLLRRPKIQYEVLDRFGYGSDSLDGIEKETVEIEIKYDGFIKRAAHQMKSMAAKEKYEIPGTIDYQSINIISMEAREKLEKFRPKTVGQAARIGGVNPSDIQALLLHMEVLRRKEAETDAGEANAKVETPATVVQ